MLRPLIAVACSISLAGPAPAAALALRNLK
jgi:hypothetical protein